MTIEKGADWGRAAPLPSEGIIVSSDAEARSIVEAAKRANRPIPPLGLLGGDLCRTLGGTGDEVRLRSRQAMTFPIDLGSVLADGKIHWFVAHAVARRSWWHGRIIAAMNAQWLGGWDLGPRSHPNDGLLDYSDADLPLGDRLKARSRLPLGTHVPHPRIVTTRTDAMQFDLDPALTLYLDGEVVGPAHRLSIRLEPDALTVVV